jgi:hypothetical protein
VLLFIGLFATVHGAQNRSAAYRVLLALSAFKFALGTAPQYHPHATETIATLGFAQQRVSKDDRPLYILKGVRSFKFDRLAEHKYKPILI